MRKSPVKILMRNFPSSGVHCRSAWMSNGNFADGPRAPCTCSKRRWMDPTDGRAGFGERRERGLTRRRSRRAEAPADFGIRISDFGFLSWNLIASAATVSRQGQRQLLLLAQRPRLKTRLTQRLRKVGGK